MRGRSVGGIPTPVSATATSTRPSAAGRALTVTRPPSGVYLTALSTRLMRIWASRSRSALTGGSPDGSWLASATRAPPPGGPRGRGAERDAAELDVGEVGEVVEQPPEPLGVAEHDLEEAPRVVPFLERAAEQRLEVAVDRRERRPELVRDVRHELRAHLLEPAQLRDVVEHHHDAGLRARQAQRHRVHLEPPVGRPGEPELVARDAGRPRRADGPEEVVQGRVADDLEERSALEARRVEAEHGARPLVHQEDRAAPVHSEHALDHAVEDRGRLGLLLLEVADLLAEPPHHRVERPAQRADLVGRAHRRARGEVARAHAAGGSRSPLPSLAGCPPPAAAVTRGGGRASRRTPTTRPASWTGSAT